MARVVDLTGENVTRQRRKERTYGTKTDLASTVVERGSTHWAEGSNVHIDGLLGVAGTATVSGTLRVTGLLDVTGTFNGSGTNNLDGTNNLSGDNNLTGPTEISGSLDVTGPTTIDGVLTINGDTSITGLLEVTGDTTISGTLDIEGNTTVASDFEIIAGGLFKSGVTEIEPTGKATFGPFVIDPNSAKLIEAPGGYVISNGMDQIGLSSSNSSSVNLSNLGATLDYLGTITVHAGPTKSELKFGTVLVTARAGAIDLTAPTTHISGISNHNGVANFNAAISYTGRPAPTGNTANLYVASSGYIYEVSSSERYKADVQPLDLDERLLDVRLVDWVDRSSQEAFERLQDAPRPFTEEDQFAWDTHDMTRHPGAIAEEVLEAGGASFVGLDDEGKPHNLSYDRFALARTALLYERIKLIEQRLGA